MSGSAHRSTKPFLAFLPLSTSAGLFRSDDGGVTWRSIQPPDLKQKIFDLAVGPSRPDRLWAAAWNNPMVVYTGGRLAGIWESTDGGATWPAGAATGVTSDVFNAASEGSQRVFFFDPTTIFVRPRKPNIVLVGINQTGIFRSTDGGQTFTKAMRSIGVAGVGETPPGEKSSADQDSSGRDVPRALD